MLTAGKPALGSAGRARSRHATACQMRRRGEMSSGERGGGGCAKRGRKAFVATRASFQSSAGACDEGIASTWKVEAETDCVDM